MVFAMGVLAPQRLHVRVCTAATACIMCVFDTAAAAAALLYCLAWQYLDHYPFNFYTVLQEVRGNPSHRSRTVDTPGEAALLLTAWLAGGGAAGYFGGCAAAMGGNDAA